MVIDKVAISKSINKIITSFGGTPTHKTTDLDDCLADLANNMPFGTKTETVAIVPEQSVTGYPLDGENIVQQSSGWEASDGYEPIPFIRLTAGNNYKIVINGKEYAGKSNDDDECPRVEIGEWKTDEYVMLEYDSEENETYLEWAMAYGETITLAIYEEQEVVTPIDIKYLPIEELKKALGIGGEA